MECRQAIQSLLYHQGHVRAILWNRRDSNAWPKGWSILGPTRTFPDRKRFPYYKGSYLYVWQSSWVANYWRGWSLWLTGCQSGANRWYWKVESLWINGRLSLIRARVIVRKTVLLQPIHWRGQNPTKFWRRFRLICFKSWWVQCLSIQDSSSTHFCYQRSSKKLKIPNLTTLSSTNLTALLNRF